MNTPDQTPKAAAGADILRLMKNEVIERMRFILREDPAEGLRLQVPDTSIYIIAGPEAWIAEHTAPAAWVEFVRYIATAQPGSRVDLHALRERAKALIADLEADE